MFESRISAGSIEKLPGSGELDANFSSWSYDMEGHAKKCVEKILRTGKRNSTVLQSRNSMLTTTNSKKQKWDLLENCQKYAHKLF